MDQKALELELYRSALLEGYANGMSEALLIARAHSIKESGDVGFDKGYEAAARDIASALEITLRQKQNHNS